MIERRHYTPVPRWLPRWLMFALTALPIAGLWAVDGWAVADYMRHKAEQAEADRIQSIRDVQQDNIVLLLREEVGRQHRVMCAVALKLNVVSSDCIKGDK